MAMNSHHNKTIVFYVTDKDDSPKAVFPNSDQIDHKLDNNMDWINVKI